MKIFIPVCFVIILAISCKSGPGTDKQYAGPKGTDVFQLRLNPADGSQYYYDITNETEFQLEVDDKKVKNLNRTNVGITYDVHKDSAGNFLLSIVYNNIHLYSKSGDKVTDIEATNSAFSTDIAEQMLGSLKEATIIVTVNPAGEVQSMTGYKELGEKIIAGLNTVDMNVKSMVQTQLDKLIGEGLIKKNIDQLFKMFPDSAVHVGDKWKIISGQKDDFSMSIKNFFTLKKIDDDIAYIDSEGDIVSDSISANLTSYNNVQTNLNGHQEGKYEMEAKTGMMINSKISAKINGMVVMMGREVPVVMKTTVKTEGRKVK